jgi:glycine dehydrogenase
VLAAGAERLNYRVVHDVFFDTVRFDVGTRTGGIVAAAAEPGINLRGIDETSICVALDETTDLATWRRSCRALNRGSALPFSVRDLVAEVEPSAFPGALARRSGFLEHPSSTATTPRRRCCATSACWSRATCR